MKRVFSTMLFAIGLLCWLAALVFWFTAIWTHGHDLTTRLSGSGFLAVVTGGVFCIAGVLVGE